MSASATSSAEEIATTASDLVAREGGVYAFFTDVGVGGIGYSLILQAISGITATGLLLFGPIRALGEMTILFVTEAFRSLVSVLDAGTQTTVYAFTDGLTRLLGPLAQPTAVGVIMLSLVVFFYGINYVSWSPWAFVTSIRE